MSTPKGQSVDVTSLSTQDLSAYKKRFDSELEHLGKAFQQLRAAQAKFRECLRSISTGVTSKVDGVPILVPLTTSLYVPGTLADTENVIVDVGTGFYVEKKTKDAMKFYEVKVAELETNLKNLDGIIQDKSNDLMIVEDVLRQKVLSAGSSASVAT